MSMLKRLMALSVAMLALAACETTPEETGATAGAGGAAGSGSGTPGMSPSTGYSTSPVPSSGTQRGALGNSAAVERELVSVGDTVYFAFDSYSLDDRAQGTLDRQASVLMKSGSIPVTIEGHADERGTREYNLALGERRASAVKDYLVAYGVSPGRLRTISYGEERPAALGSSEADWAKNRRAVTVVVGAAAGS
jgi:peptidoglycan-associated lipoprotein